MADLMATQSTVVQKLLDNLDLYKHNPSAIQQTWYDYIDEITEGKVNLVDPTNPFVMLMEASSLNTALAVNEGAALLTKMNASLSQTEEDLYRHMSDKDYLNRFSSPSTATFTVVMQVNDVLNKMTYDATEGAYKATIPRDTKFKIDNYIFTLLYPIDIRKFDSGMVQVSYDASIASPIDDLTTNIIPTVVRRDRNQVDWMFFDVPVKQFEIVSTNYPVQVSSVFSQDVTYKDKFMYGRAFYRNSDTGNKWVEMKTTHTDQVYDPLKPTMVFQVYSGFVRAKIPMIYLNTNQVKGEVRIDLYTTKGLLVLNLADYKPNSFEMLLQPIDEERDLTDYVAAMGRISYYSFSKDFVTGGSNGVDFPTLRERVINNSTGPQIIPITPNQVQARVESDGFTLVKNVDTITNRIFLATQKLPKPLNEKLATSANIGIVSFITTMEYLQSFETVASNGQRCTIMSNNLYLNENGIIRLLTSSEVAALRALGKLALTTEVNSKKYMFSPYYYVLDDTNQEFSVRAYDLDNPVASNLSFISQNQSLKLPVNTNQFTLTKTSTGYALRVLTASGDYYKQLNDGNVFAQLGYYPHGENRMAYINGTLVDKDAEGNRLWNFDLISDHDITDEDLLNITNGKMFNDETVETKINLFQTFHIFHATNSVNPEFVPDDADALLGKFLLPSGTVADTHETVDLQTGQSLKQLWTRSRSFAEGMDYERHTTDVPLYYTEDIYERDPITGSSITVEEGQINYNIIHNVGDPVLDEGGAQVYRWRVGDPVLDSNGNPIVVSDMSIKKEIDMLFVDGRHFFVDDPAFVAYNRELVAILDSWILDDVAAIQKVLLEKTYIYFFPKTMLGQAKVFIEDQGEDNIPSEQSLVLNLYVKSDVYSDLTVRQQLVTKSIKLLDDYISRDVVNMTEISNALGDTYGDSVQSLNVSGLGGSKNYQIVTLADEQNRLCLKKILSLQQDNSLIIREDVTVNFFKIR